MRRVVLVLVLLVSALSWAEAVTSKKVLKLRDKGDVKGLSQLVRKGGPMADEAAAALGKLKDPRGVDVLIEALSRGHSPSVMWALGEIGDPRAARPLVTALTRSPYLPFQYLATALKKIGEPAAEALVDAPDSLDDSDEDRVRKALLHVGAAAAAPLVEALSTKREAIRFRSADAVARILEKGSRDAKEQMLGRLETLSDPEAVPALLATASRSRGRDSLSGKTRGHLRDVLARVAREDPRAIDHLLAGATSADADRQQVAVAELAKLAEEESAFPHLFFETLGRLRSREKTLALEVSYVGGLVTRIVEEDTTVQAQRLADYRRSMGARLAKLGYRIVEDSPWQLSFAFRETLQQPVSGLMGSVEDDTVSYYRAALQARGESLLTGNWEGPYPGTFLSEARNQPGTTYLELITENLATLVDVFHAIRELDGA